MARTTNRLTARGVMALKEPGLFADGSGLYLRVDQTGARRWVWIFHYHKKRREMGLGSLEVVGLADARAAADVARRILADGRDPIEERRLALMPSTSRLFSAVVNDLMDALEPSWKSPKQRGQWEASLMQHAGQIWKADVSAVDTAMVLEALKPVWATKPETATRIRSRIERVGAAKRMLEEHEEVVGGVVGRLLSAGALSECEIHDTLIDEEDGEAVETVRDELALELELSEAEADGLVEEAMLQAGEECYICANNRERG